MKRTLIVGITLVAALVPSSSAVSAPADEGGAKCGRIDFSPDYASDRTAVCAAVQYEVGAGAVAVTVSMTRDGGRSWNARVAAGIPVTPLTRLNGVLFSGRFAQDKAIYVQTGDGLYRTQDDGQTFVAVDPLAGTASTSPNLIRLPTGTAIEVPQLPAPIAMASSDALGSAVLMPPLHLPVAGSPDNDWRFLVAPPGEGPHARKVFAVAARSGEGGTGRPVLYSCNEVLACVGELHMFPDMHVYVGSHLPADFARTGVMYLWTKHFTTRLVTVWVSRDGGGSFTPWVAGNTLLKQPIERGFPRAIDIGLVTDPSRAGRMYLRVAGERGLDPPQQQLWRSDDNGKRWQLMGYMRNYTPMVRGTLPWYTEEVFAVRGNISVQPDGKVFVIARATSGSSYGGVFCSHDGARTWARSCR